MDDEATHPDENVGASNTSHQVSDDRLAAGRTPQEIKCEKPGVRRPQAFFSAFSLAEAGRPQWESKGGSGASETSEKPAPIASTTPARSATPDDVSVTDALGQTERVRDLEAAIARITKAMATADDDEVVELVAERKALRADLERVRREGADVVDLVAERERRAKR